MKHAFDKAKYKLMAKHEERHSLRRKLPSTDRNATKLHRAIHAIGDYELPEYDSVDTIAVNRRQRKVDEPKEYAESWRNHDGTDAGIINLANTLLLKGYNMRRIAKAFSVKRDWLQRHCVKAKSADGDKFVQMCGRGIRGNLAIEDTDTEIGAVIHQHDIETIGCRIRGNTIVVG